MEEKRKRVNIGWKEWRDETFKKRKKIEEDKHELKEKREEEWHGSGMPSDILFLPTVLWIA